MALTVRTDQQLEQALDALAETEGTSKQEVIRRAVMERLGAVRACRPCRRLCTADDLALGRPGAAPRYRVNHVEYLILEDILQFVRDLGLGPVRDVGLLESAVARPRRSAFGGDAYSSVTLPAAAPSTR